MFITLNETEPSTRTASMASAPSIGLISAIRRIDASFLISKVPIVDLDEDHSISPSGCQHLKNR